MQTFIRRLTGNPYLLPLLVVCIGIWRLFMPQLPANGGLGWDGAKYYDLTVNGFNSQVLDSYLVLRIFPCLFIHILFKVFSISFAPQNVILGFKIMNTVLIGLGAFMVKGIFDRYKLNPISQLTGFVLVFFNYGVLNFTYYYPVMTDTPAFVLGIALFYFFVRGEFTNVLLTGLIGAFTWPLLLPMAFTLVLLSKTPQDFQPLPRGGLYTLGLLCVAYAVGTGYYFIIQNGARADDMYTLPVSEGMLPVTFLYMAILYFGFACLLANKRFFDFSYYRSLISWPKIMALIAVALVFVLLRSLLKVNATSEFLSPFTQIKITMVYAFQRPLIAVVSHINYFGCGILLCLVFWKRISAFIAGFGPGVAISIFVSVFLFFAQAETRRLTYLFPWVLILVSLFLGQYRFSTLFYVLIFAVNFATAKLYLFFDYSGGSRPLSDGTLGFPDQWFLMNLGRWMTENTWLWLCVLLIVSLLLFMVSLYRIKLSKQAILFYKKYEPLSYE